jgi:hypothetical protein
MFRTAETGVKITPKREWEPTELWSLVEWTPADESGR